jgi:predicted RNA-binding protein YlqC (UPF0109 family)
MSTYVYVLAKYYWGDQIKTYETDGNDEKKILVKIFEWNKLFGRQCRLVDGIRMVLEAIRCDRLGWI